MEQVLLKDASSVIAVYEEYMQTFGEAADKLKAIIARRNYEQDYYFFKTRRYAHGGIFMEHSFLVVLFPYDLSKEFAVEAYPIEFWNDFEVKVHYTLEPQLPKLLHHSIESINIVKSYYERQMDKIQVIKY